MSVRITFPKATVAFVLLGAALTLAPASAAAAVFLPAEQHVATSTTTTTTPGNTVTPADIDWP